VADLLSSDDEKWQWTPNYEKVQVIFWENPIYNQYGTEHFFSWTWWEEFKILYIDSLTTLRRIIISRKEIVKKNLSELKIDTGLSVDDNNEIIKRFIEHINIKLGKNIYEELRKIYQEETLERVDLVVNKVYDRNLSEIHKKRLPKNLSKWKEEIPDQEWDKWKEEILDQKLNQWLWLKDFNILVQEWKIDIKTFKYIINLLNNKEKVDINNLYDLYEDWIITKLISYKINESKLIDLINNTNPLNLNFLINNITTKSLSSLINNTNTKSLSSLINNIIAIERLISLINNTNTEKLSDLINITDIVKLTNLVNKRPKFLDKLINNTNTEKLSDLINIIDNSETEILITLIDNITDIKILSKLIDILKTENFKDLIHRSDPKELSKAIDNDFDKLVVFIESKWFKLVNIYMNIKYKLFQ
jgi:hypothetical protein